MLKSLTERFEVQKWMNGSQAYPLSILQSYPSINTLSNKIRVLRDTHHLSVVVIHCSALQNSIASATCDHIINSIKLFQCRHAAKEKKKELWNEKPLTNFLNTCILFARLLFSICSKASRAIRTQTNMFKTAESYNWKLGTGNIPSEGQTAAAKGTSQTVVKCQWM